MGSCGCTVKSLVCDPLGWPGRVFLGLVPQRPRPPTLYHTRAGLAVSAPRQEPDSQCRKGFCRANQTNNCGEYSHTLSGQSSGLLWASRANCKSYRMGQRRKEGPPVAQTKPQGKHSPCTPVAWEAASELGVRCLCVLCPARLSQLCYSGEGM